MGIISLFDIVEFTMIIIAIIIYNSLYFTTNYHDNFTNY